MIAESYPDIEIYIRDVTANTVMDWLKQHFGIEATAPRPTLSYEGQSLECLIVPNAVDDFTSVWFKTNRTPWVTDIECARDAFRFFSVEVRCNDASWGSEEGGWLKIDQHGETTIAWD